MQKHTFFEISTLSHFNFQEILENIFVVIPLKLTFFLFYFRKEISKIKIVFKRPNFINLLGPVSINLTELGAQISAQKRFIRLSPTLKLLKLQTELI